MAKKSEKRRKKRKACYVPIDAKEGTVFDQTQTVDISQGGLGMVSANAIRPRQKIAVQLDLSEEGDHVLAVGRVKWVSSQAASNTYRFGLQFDEILPGSKTRMKNLFSK